MFYASFSPNLVAVATFPNHSPSKMFWLDKLTSQTPFTSDHVTAIFYTNPVITALIPILVAMATSPNISLSKCFGYHGKQFL